MKKVSYIYIYTYNLDTLLYIKINTTLLPSTICQYKTKSTILSPTPEWLSSVTTTLQCLISWALHLPLATIPAL